MRAFVAIEIDDIELLNSIKKTQSRLELKAKPIKSDHMHFTLFFLGEISKEVLGKVRSELSTINFSSFKITFNNLGVFPKPKFPRIVWIGVDKQSIKSLNEIASKIQSKLIPLGFKQDKLFNPHVTIFRIKDKVGDISDKLTGVSISGTQKITKIKLKESVLTPDGPIYTDLHVINANNEKDS